MTTIEEACKVMGEAKVEIERLRKINKELLEACKLMLEHCGHDEYGVHENVCEGCVKTRAAIAKAEGGQS